jgi:predicted Fe-Mo cluster-binding NifX family protein
MIAAIALSLEGSAGQGWGRAPRVAVARVEDGRIDTWAEYAVGWDVLHDQGTEGGHHARIARFLNEHGVELVVAGHMGQPMVEMLGRMNIGVRLGIGGDARAAVLAATRPSTTAE